MSTELRELEARSAPVKPNGVHAPAEAARGVLVIQSARGPQRVAWQVDKRDQVAAAARAFKELREVGYRGYKLDSATHVHEEITEFDPTAGEVVLIMPMRGGAA